MVLSGYCKRKRKRGSLNGEVGPTSNVSSVLSTSEHNPSINFGPAAGIWWKILIIVAMMRSVSPFFEIPKNKKICN